MTINLTKQEMYVMLMALETEAENDLKLIKKDCNFDAYSSEAYVESYLKNLSLIKKVNEALKKEK